MKAKTSQALWKYVSLAVATTWILAGSAQATSQFQVLHHFANAPGSTPVAALVADSAGNFYGTTKYSGNNVCGGNACGVVFEISPESGGGWTYHVIHEFDGPHGSEPEAGLIFDSSGNLYGTTYGGGAYGRGTVYELSSSGNKWTERVLHNFGSYKNDVANPRGSLTLDGSGNLYGTGSVGGTSFSYGGVFELKRSGAKWQEKVICNFTGGSDGGIPSANLIWDSAGNLYGTTFGGGSTNCSYPGCGVVFELTPSSSGNWAETVLYSFGGVDDGFQPLSGLIFDTAGNLYGTTYSGSTVFELTPSTGGWTLNVLHTFGGSDGDFPAAGVVLDSAGNLYGTTLEGGNVGVGVVFELVQSGGSWTENVLHSFNAKAGEYPAAGLTLSQGLLYGTAEAGGLGYPDNSGYGIVFSITP
jgi:uncharacterized repeat protein (TIGR03803 family)